MTVGRSDWTLKFTEGSWQGSFTVNNERAIRTLKASSEQKNVLREFLQGQNLLVNLPTNFPASSNRCRQMHCRVFCNLADSSNVKTNQEIMIFTAKKKNYTHVAIQVQAISEKLYTEGLERLRYRQSLSQERTYASFSFCNRSQAYFLLFLEPRDKRKVSQRNLYCLLEIRVFKIAEL